MDCSWSFGNLSCGGGLMDNAFTYYQSSLAMLESDYPYEAKFHKPSACGYDESKGVTGAASFYDVAEDPSQLMAALNLGPVSVAIEADTAVFQNYVDGVITGDDCGTNLDHGVLAVGYGSYEGESYFLVKNSWGPSWGDNGYVKIGMADGAGVCGIQSGPPSQPSIE